MKRAFRVVVVLALLVPSTVLGYGPGMHVRESKVLLDLLAEEEPFWAEAKEADLALPYLFLGSLSPDFQWPSSYITFGHSKGLSYHLLDLAAELPVQYSLFALGHLAHAGGSDAAAEQFLAPAVFASAPLGMFDIVAGQDGPKGESEGIVEGFGDLVIGDWHGVADAIWHFWLEGEEAKARAEEIFLWYCVEGAAYSGAGTDCDAALAEFLELLGQAEGILGGFDYEKTHDLVEMIVSQPLADLADLVFAGSLGSFLDVEVAVGEHTESEKARFKESVLCDPEFWMLYDGMAMVGPSVSLAFYQDEPPAGTWPSWIDKPLFFGNIRSVMTFLPEGFAAWPGLIVDGVEYRTGQGEVLAALPAELEGEELEARIRFYAVFPFAGTVKGRVRVDHPGFFQAEDETVGEGQLELAADPVDYGTRPREELTIPFMAVADDGLGFYVELFADDTELPWFSTSWDGILPSGVLPFHWPVYKENFGTYGHWPPSLPVAEASEATGTLFVVVREAPDGLGIEGATVTLEGEEGVAGAAGLAGFDLLPAGEYEVAASAAGFAAGDEGTEAVMVVAGQTTWLELFLWAEAPVEPGPETVEPSPEWAEPTPDVVEGLPEHAEVFEELPTPDGVPPADLGTWDGLAEGELPRVEAVSEDSGGPGGCPGCSATPGGAGMGAPLLAGLLALLLGVRRKAGPNMWRTQRD